MKKLTLLSWTRRLRTVRSSAGIFAAACFAVTLPMQCADVRSVSRISFGPENVLFVADWAQSKVHAIALPAASSAASQPFNIADLDALLRKTVGNDNVTLTDLAMRPGSGEAYIAATLGPAKTPVIVVISADGRAHALDLGKTQSTSASLDKAPSADLKFWDTIPGRSFTVTDMKWRDGKLFLAGLSNQSFASSLRIIPYPFGQANGMASVEMYHTSHDQMETRAPIRAMAFADLDGKPHLLAAYLCTPLVTIPLDSLTNGAHVKAKTIAELGDAGTPVEVLPYRSMDLTTGKQVSYVLVANMFREASIIPLGSIEEANRRAGFTKPVPFGQIAGVQRMGATMSPVMRIDNQDEHFFVALRRDLATGHSQLVSINKLATFRLSDYDISEYMFPDYKYAKDQTHDGIRQMQNMLKTEEGFPGKVVQ